jgi:hypothetical protein
MLPEPLRQQLPSPERLDALREIQRDQHERLFGEELARVNLDFTLEERLAYLSWMRDTVRRSGRELPPSYSVAWLLEVEKEVEAEEAKKP